MFVALIAKTTATEPSAVREGEGRHKRHDPEDRLHLSAIVAGLIDARACHVDFLDTAGGQELERWYRRHHPRARGHVRQ
ncbi:MAG TPA: hypothetical protein VK964_09640 [Nocardioidaceae bacterium]|nr:hypothetical protein [Nocardioidaceae bacterium]